MRLRQCDKIGSGSLRANRVFVCPLHRCALGESTLPFNGFHSSEFQFHLHGNHAWAAIATQAHAEQTSGWRCRISERSKSFLGRGFPQNASQHEAGQSKVGMIEDIEELRL